MSGSAWGTMLDDVLRLLPTVPLTREEWHVLDAALLAVWRARFEGSDKFPVRWG